MPGEETSEEKGIYFHFACNSWFNKKQDMLIFQKTIGPICYRKGLLSEEIVTECKSRISDQ